MVISSLVVETMPEHTQAAAEALAQLPGVEVHEIVDHKIVVTIEAETTDASYDIASKFVNRAGVTGINLVYSNFEDDPTIKRGDR